MVKHEHRIVKDFFLSKEEFVLVKDPSTNLLKTTPKPSEKNLVNYYASKDYISHNNSSITLFSKTYFLARTLAMWPKNLLISKYFDKPNTALDIGSGSGFFIAQLKKKKWEANGYEPNKIARDFAIKKGVTHIASLEDAGSSQYDLITFWHSLEHVYLMQDTLEKSINALKKNGIMMIACPNYKSWDAKHYGSFWAAYDVPRHLRHFAPDTLIKIMEPMGMKQINQWPLLLDAFYISMLSEKNLKSKFWILKGLALGFYSNLHGFVFKSYSSQIYVFKKTF